MFRSSARTVTAYDPLAPHAGDVPTSDLFMPIPTMLAPHAGDVPVTAGGLVLAAPVSPPCGGCSARSLCWACYALTLAPHAGDVPFEADAIDLTTLLAPHAGDVPDAGFDSRGKPVVSPPCGGCSDPRSVDRSYDTATLLRS